MKDLFGKLSERTHKGDMGRLLVICGSYDDSGISMCGAAYFSAAAAYRTGAGIVEIFTPRENYSALSALVPEAVFSLYGYDEDTDMVSARLAVAISRADAVVIGCGLGKSQMAKALVKRTLAEACCPLLIDADGLNILSEDESLWVLLGEKQREQTVITPHPGEMARLCGVGVDEIAGDVPRFSRLFAEKRGVVCLLKDHNTAISNGERVYVNQSGNAGMATAGMGDLLAGIIGALMARGGEAFECARVGAYLHGLAGDLAAEKLGEYSVTASAVLSEIPAAVRQIIGNNTQN